MSGCSHAVAALASVVLLFALERSAAADAKHACVEAAHRGQNLRDAGKLGSARDTFLACSVEACPTVVRESCQRWAAEVEPRVPTIVLGARDDAQRDLAEVRVSLDGALLTRTLDGRAIAVDPGPHELLFEAQGFATARQSVIVREGEKARAVVAVLASAATDGSAAARPSAATGATGEAEEPARPPSRNLAPLLVAGAVGAVGLSSFAIFGLWGNDEKQRLFDTCAASQTCDPSEVSAARTKLIVADVSLVVGLAGVGVLTGYLIAPLLRSSPPASAAKPSRSSRAGLTSFGLTPAPNGVLGGFVYTY